MDAYVTRLRGLAKTCDYADIDKEIYSQIVQCCRSVDVRKKALQEVDLSLDDLLSYGRSLESSERQSASISGQAAASGTSTVNKVSQKRGKGAFGKPKPHNPNNTCRNCGGPYPHQKECPAKGKECNYCHNLNHFEHCCRKKQQAAIGPRGTQRRPQNRQRKPVNNVEEQCEEQWDNEEYAFSVQISAVEKQPKVTLYIRGKQAEFLIDSGCSRDIIDEETYTSMKNPPMLKRCSTQIFGYGKTPIATCGEFEANIKSEVNNLDTSIIVVQGHHGNLLASSQQKLFNLLM